MRWLAVLGIGLVIGLAACGEGETEQATPVPTRTLIPPTKTPTPAPVEGTPTPTDLPSASALSAASPAASVAAIPAAAQTMIDRTMRDLLAQPRVDRENIRLVGLDAFTWRDASWSCQTRDEDERPGYAVTSGYRIVFSTGRRVYVYHTDRRETFFVCEDRAWLVLEGDPIPLDPVAQSMVELSARDAAKRLNVPETEIHLTSLVAVEWPDSSVGCPRPEADYEETPMPGYRMVFRAGEETLIYHTSIRHVVHCTLDEEILPEFLRRALPTPELDETE